MAAQLTGARHRPCWACVGRKTRRCADPSRGSVLERRPAARARLRADSAGQPGNAVVRLRHEVGAHRWRVRCELGSRAPAPRRARAQSFDERRGDPGSRARLDPTSARRAHEARAARGATGPRGVHLAAFPIRGARPRCLPCRHTIARAAAAVRAVCFGDYYVRSVVRAGPYRLRNPGRSGPPAPYAPRHLPVRTPAKTPRRARRSHLESPRLVWARWLKPSSDVGATRSLASSTEIAIRPIRATPALAARKVGEMAVDAVTDAEAAAGADRPRAYGSTGARRTPNHVSFTNRNSARQTPTNRAAETASEVWILVKLPARPTVMPLKVRRPEAAMA